MIIAVDTGGTKTLVARFSDDGTKQNVVRFPTPAIESDYVNQLVVTLTQVIEDRPVDAIVVALPGIVKDGVAIWCNKLQWANFDVRSALQARFPRLPIFVENDANLGGLGEVSLMTTPPTTALYTTISTGIGTGYIVGGMIDPGMRLSEGGRMLVEFDGAVREWETFASGSSIVRTYNTYARDIHDEAIWGEIADRISRGFLAAIPLIQPDVIIIGGSIGTFFDQYEVRLSALLAQHLPAHIPLPTIVEAKHPEEAVIYGGYAYGAQQLAS